MYKQSALAEFQAYYGSVAGLRIWNEIPLYADSNWNWHYPPAMFYQPIDQTKQTFTEQLAADIRWKYGWWLTDWQCWARLGLGPAEEQSQAAYEH